MKVTKHDIGGELLSILTKGMYSDPKDALREYIQNGVDAMASEISVKIRHDGITVVDDGKGMDNVVMRKAVRVGISEKNPRKSVGFMGIGLYSSFHLCDLLTIYSKVKGANPNVLTFDFKSMRNDLDNQKQLRLSATRKEITQIDLLTLLETNIQFYELSINEFPSEGTRVEMSGLDPNFFRSLSKQEEVAEYLERVLPLPFSKDFAFGDKIYNRVQKVCEKHKTTFRTIELVLDINGVETKLYRPYKDIDFKDKSNPNDHPLTPKFFEMTSSDGFLGLAWGCLNSGRKTIPNGKVRGFIIKKMGFTIGKREDLLPHFGRATYFNRYVGEFIAMHPQLLPNGPRSDFEFSSVRTTFYGKLKAVADSFNEIADEYQEAERAKLDLSEAIDLFNEINTQLEFFKYNGDKLLDFYQQLNDVKKTLDKKSNAEKFKDSSSQTKLAETLKKINALLKQDAILDWNRDRNILIWQESAADVIENNSNNEKQIKESFFIACPLQVENDLKQ